MRVLSLLRRLFEAVSTLFLVTAIAAFVWLYAEQKTVDQNKLTLELEYGTEEQRRDLFILTRGAPRKVEVSFKSSNRTVDEIKAKLAGGTLFAIPLDITSDMDTFSIRERLEKSLFQNVAASNLQVTQDRQLSIGIERFTTVEFPLGTDSGRITSSVEWEPKPTVATARLPAHIADSFLRNKSVATARLDSISLTNVRLGEKVARQVKVEIPALALFLADPKMPQETKDQILKKLDLTPAALTASFTLERSVNSEVHLTRPVPVNIVAPPSENDKWSFSIPDANEKFLNDLRLSCTSETAKLIKDNEEAILDPDSAKKSPLVWAVVRVPLPTEVPPSGLLTLPLEVMTPPGSSVSPASLLLLPKTITVKAVLRAQ